VSVLYYTAFNISLNYFQQVRMNYRSGTGGRCCICARQILRFTH